MMVEKIKFLKRGEGNRPVWRNPNVWIALILLAANGIAWFRAANRITFPEVAPILHPHIAEVRSNWQSGEASGETFELIITDQEAMETITWFLQFRDLPVSHPYIEIHPDHIVGGGVLHLLGLQTPALGQADVWIENGKLTGNVTSVTVSGTQAPGFVLAAIDQGKSYYDNLSFPIELTTLELREGSVYLAGVYR